ncbi:MAG TPA: thermonuclease family protein [Ignavibacteria bacterium]|nr:thermonuclease family protein [Ignavibacteria bacterium]
MKSLIKLTFKSVFTLGVIVILAYFGWKYILPKLNEREQRERKEYVITKVFDGDTFEAEINGKKEKVRMLGIDTPEKFDSDKLTRDMERTKKDSETIKKLGELSSQFTRKLLEGKKVLLEPDKSQDDKDKYGRLLRYVYLEDGTFVNEKIVAEGYAVVFRKFKVSKEKELIDAETDARKGKKGLWGDIEGLKYMESSND